MLQRAARNAYSWWWASHIRTKQSKWLDQNLQDMEEKVEHILKIIEEDGDSFAQRAEMYYRKRPELLNFVEDSFRGYRALAERYDKLSKELQTANRTIATVYPEQVQLGIDEDDEISPISSSSDDPKPLKNLPAPPEIRIPNNDNNIQKRARAKAPVRIMSRKGLLKFDIPETGNKLNDEKSGMKKDEALKKIDEFQKLILGLQTEREFVQSSYENGLKKYFEIEERITEMQSQVSNLQDEYGIGTFIEDDEARTLMAATALKTCQEALNRLQDKQKQADEVANLEYERVKKVHEKLAFLKGNLGGVAFDEKIELEEKADDGKVEKVHDSTPVTMTEMAEKIDDLVEKVITLETAFSSQNALVMRLRSETDDLQAQIQSIEQDKEALIEGVDSKRDKIVELEQELARIKNLNMIFRNEKRKLQSSFTEASFTVDHLSEKLKTVKQDEEVENTTTISQISKNVPVSELGIKVEEVTIVSDQDLKNLEEIGNRNTTAIDEVEKHNAIVNGEEQKLDVPVSELGIKVEEVTIVSDQDLKNLEEIGNRDTAAIAQSDSKLISTGHDIPVSESGIKVEEVTIVSDQDLNNLGEIKNRYTTAIAQSDSKMISTGHESENTVHGELSTCLDDLFVNAQGTSDHEKKMEQEVNDNYAPDLSKMDGQSVSSFNPFDFEEGFKAEKNQEARADDVANSGNDNPGKEEIYENQDIQFNTSNPFENSLDSLLGEDKISRKDEAIATSSDDKLISEQRDEDDDQPYWKELFLNGLEDREKVLLQQYTSTLRNFKETKKQLSEMEKKKHDSLFESESKIKELKNANERKDAEIQSLHRKLDLLQGCLEENQETSTIDSSNEKSNSKQDQDQAPDEPAQENGEQDSNLTAEERFRSDIDGLLEENIEFWLRFSTSFQQIQKFQTSVEDLHDELAKLKETPKDTNSKQNHPSSSEIRAIYNHLREIQNELTLWVEENSLLEFDLRHRLTSLSRLQGEISSSSDQGNKENEMLSDYQAAKFQGEILIMKQENNQVAQKLKLGLERVKELQNEISKTVSNLGDQLGVSIASTEKKKSSKSSSLRSKVPLKSFLFGGKLKKPKQSLFHCMTPALQKQYSDIHSSQT